MIIKALKTNPVSNIIKSTLIKLPAPANISLIWNMGSLLSVCLILQIITGLILASNYRASIELRFNMVLLSIERVNKLWLTRQIHANGASLFFICMALHIGRGIYYSSFILTHTWIIGCNILILTIAAAFLGYVLPINQISFWGASVITNLFTEVPYLGKDLVKFCWGGSFVHSPTIIRFFTFHFLIPFIILILVVFHITFLHQTGSRNPTGLNRKTRKIYFNQFFTNKDIYGFIIIIFLFIYLCLYYPLVLGDNENFIPANPAVTPRHIQPEWYFLFAYAILRSIPNKLGGVIALALSVIIYYILPITFISKSKLLIYYPINNIIFWLFSINIALLSWIGTKSVEDPFIFTGQALTVSYFLYFLINPILSITWEKINY